jgi:ABC-type phosphate/phosphonate transport system permease subunit
MYIATRAESSPGRGRNISWNRLNEKNSKESAVRQTRKNGSKDEQTILSRFLYGSLPVVYQDVKHYTAYWFECALRSSAVLGFIGLPTQGFFIDSAFADHKLDKAIILILIAAVLNMGIDTISQVLRRRLKISTKLVTSF